CGAANGVYHGSVKRGGLSMFQKGAFLHNTPIYFAEITPDSPPLERPNVPPDK
ncbi:MAG: hypothetical protein ACI9PU_001121, partial [Ascidiaceihabitans sp.]